MISVLILTHNEELDLPGCLDSVAWSDDVHVFDSLSTDRTAEIAREHGANLVERRFDNYASQRNAALAGLPFRYPWVFMLDADERPTPELVAEMQQAVAQASDDMAAYRMPRHDLWRQKWLKHAPLSPFNIRLLRPDKVQFVRNINELLEIEGEVGELSHWFNHYPFSKGMAFWLEKHNRYSTMEAVVVAEGTSKKDASWRKALFGRDFHERRRAQKALFYQMPARPIIKWLYVVLVRRALLDGRAGITYATLQALYEYMIVLKTREILDKKQP